MLGTTDHRHVVDCKIDDRSKYDWLRPLALPLLTITNLIYWYTITKNQVAIWKQMLREYRLCRDNGLSSTGAREDSDSREFGAGQGQLGRGQAVGAKGMIANGIGGTGVNGDRNPRHHGANVSGGSCNGVGEMHLQEVSSFKFSLFACLFLIFPLTHMKVGQHYYLTISKKRTRALTGVQSGSVTLGASHSKSWEYPYTLLR